MSDTRTYTIRGGSGTEPVAFAADPQAGRSADETAVGILADWSTQHPGVWALVFDPGPGASPVAIAGARSGVAYLFVPLDDVAADAMHSGPLGWVRRNASVRRGLIEPTHWKGAA